MVQKKLLKFPVTAKYPSKRRCKSQFLWQDHVSYFKTLSWPLLWSPLCQQEGNCLGKALKKMF